jgi:hypothetical protein
VREVGAEPINPVTDRFMADVDSSLMEQVFDIPQGQRKSNIQHHRELDNFGRGLEVAER